MTNDRLIHRLIYLNSSRPVWRHFLHALLKASKNEIIPLTALKLRKKLKLIYGFFLFIKIHAIFNFKSRNHPSPRCKESNRN